MSRTRASLLGLALLLGGCADAGRPVLLVGSQTQAPGEGLYRYRFDADRGLVAAQPDQRLGSDNSSWLALSADRRRLFVAHENGPGQADPRGAVGSFAIDPGDRRLAPLSRVTSGGDEPTYLSLAPDGRFLFVAHYAAQAEPGGDLTVLPVDAQGRLGPPRQRLRHPARGVDEARQASSHVHAAVPSPDGRYLFASDLGADRVYAYHYRPDAAAPLAPAKPPFLATPPGGGPRHLVFDADGAHAYLTLEMADEVVVLERHGARLVPRQRLPLAEAGPPPVSEGDPRRAGALRLSADGRVLYAISRGPRSLLAAYAVDPASGRLRLLQRRPLEGREPRDVALDPSGRWLLVADQGSDELLVIRRDPASGRLLETHQRLALPRPLALRFLDAP